MPSLRCITLATALLTAMGCALAVPSEALAQGAVNKDAEKMRLIEEMNRLAAKNAWAGVERSYEQLLALKVDLSFDVHYMGAQSARYLGKTWEVYQRLQAAKALKAQEDVVQNLSAMDETYGRVRIKGDPRRMPTLSRGVMPFAPDERKSIEWAQTVVSSTGSFEGMLPLGTYEIVGCFEFEVKPGADWQIVEVPKKCGEKGELIVYAGPIGTLGPGFAITPMPSEEKEDQIDQAQPLSITGAGLALQLGGEVGFSKTIGVAATVGYQGTYGGDNLHGLNGWLALAVRPGDLRVAVGPTYGYFSGRGSGIAPYFWEEQVDESDFDRETERWYGYSLAGGAQLSAGYGLMDFGKLQGVVELGGAWQTDGVRNYMGFGLRVGIVPKVPRFEE